MSAWNKLTLLLVCMTQMTVLPGSARGQQVDPDEGKPPAGNVAERVSGQISHMRAMIVEDGGRSFADRGHVEIPYEERPIEPMIVERKAGSLWMLLRTVYGIGESFSQDRGKTWTPLQPSAIRHTTSRFFITRLQSGHLLLVKHGQINERTEGPTQRRELMAFVSADDGATWSGGLMLDERAPVSYPDGQQTADGKIRIIWDHSRSREQEIWMATFTEEDVLSGSPEAQERVRRNRMRVSKGGQPCEGRRGSMNVRITGGEPERILWTPTPRVLVAL